MQPILFAVFLDFSGTPFWMSAAAIVVLAIGLWTARDAIVHARGIDKVVALGPVSFALPLAVFGALHLADARSLLSTVPGYMPGRMFWVYFVGFALIAASLSIATNVQMRWAGLLFGIMMFLFVAIVHLPGAVSTGGRLPWTIVIRETSFGAGGWVLAGIAMGGTGGGRLIQIGRVLIAIAAIFFGVENLLHPLGLPVVPLVKQMPTWIPARASVDYATGVFLISAGVCFLLGRAVRTAAAYLGAWIVLLVVVIYGPVLIGALQDPRAAVEIEGLNYFADTLLFGGVILALARGSSKSS